MNITTFYGRKLGELAASFEWFQSDIPCEVNVYGVDTVKMENGKESLDINEFVIENIKTVDCKTLTGQWNNDESRECFLIGYDVETAPMNDGIEQAEGIGDVDDKTHRLVSHQFYFAFCGYRKCLILITSSRFTENGLIEMLAVIAEEDVMLREIVDLKAVISAHFSLYEGGWLILEEDIYE